MNKKIDNPKIKEALDILLAVRKFLCLIFLFLLTVFHNNALLADNNLGCSRKSNGKISLAWQTWHPYTYKDSNGRLTGLDIEIAKIIFAKLDAKLDYQEKPWTEVLQSLKGGCVDVAPGATYDDTRAEYAYFSDPYRYEEDSLFVLKDSDNYIEYSDDNITGYLTQLRYNNFRIGVIKDTIFVNKYINKFVNSKKNQDIIKHYNDTEELFDALMSDKIDGFLADKIVGSAVIINNSATDEIKEINFEKEIGIHFIFSKSTVPKEFVTQVNAEIKELARSNKYNNIIKSYLYPVVVLQTIESQWLYIMGLIGTTAFAFSGIIIALRNRASFFKALLLAMLPSIGGMVIRDVITNQDPITIILTPAYMYIVLILVSVAYAITKFASFYEVNLTNDKLFKQILQPSLILCDFVGQSAFIVIGISIVVVTKISPIILWGPFFAFVTSYGGLLIRNSLQKSSEISYFDGYLNPEISIIGAVAFSIFLENYGTNLNYTSLVKVAFLVFFVVFILKTLCYYFKIPSIKFG